MIYFYKNIYLLAIISMTHDICCRSQEIDTFICKVVLLELLIHWFVQIVQMQTLVAKCAKQKG